jgi:hypothetical protein
MHRTFIPAFLALLFFVSFSAAWADTAPAAIDFHQTVLPILKDSCFACHLPGGDAPYASKDPGLEKKIKKEAGDGVEALTMGDKFPFASDDSPAKQLKHLEKLISRQKMPPRSQSELGLGLPLTDKNRKVLLDWIAQENTNLR